MEISDEHDLMFTMRNIYTDSNMNSLTKFTGSSRNTEFEDIFPCYVSQMITKIISINTKIVISYAKKWGILF